MPTYEYQCKNCGFELEELQSMKEPPLVRCPNCKTDSLARIMSSGSGLIFKGSGFYLTDYKKSDKKEAPKTKKKEETKSDSSASPPSPESKSSESKPSGDSAPPPAKKE
ncbi:MAG: Zinc ribbon domain protein [Bacteroidetes bacterium]|nr:Zinc ribbon domain protein [Bacteroidota bacterium]